MKLVPHANFEIDHRRLSTTNSLQIHTMDLIATATANKLQEFDQIYSVEIDLRPHAFSNTTNLNLK